MQSNLQIVMQKLVLKLEKEYRIYLGIYARRLIEQFLKRKSENLFIVVKVNLNPSSFFIINLIIL